MIKHGLLENASFISDFPNKTSIHRGFSIAMFDYQTDGSYHHVFTAVRPNCTPKYGDTIEAPPARSWLNKEMKHSSICQVRVTIYLSNVHFLGAVDFDMF